MATAVGRGTWFQFKDSKKRKSCNRSPRICHVSASYSAGAVAADPYQTLRIQPSASESDVRKAFRKLALQYHPDVCRGNNCGVQFHLINEAYDLVMKNLRGEPNEPQMEVYEACDAGINEPMRGMHEPDWDMWEEWMGWEGAGIRDYSSHINPYI